MRSFLHESNNTCQNVTNAMAPIEESNDSEAETRKTRSRAPVLLVSFESFESFERFESFESFECTPPG